MTDSLEYLIKLEEPLMEALTKLSNAKKLTLDRINVYRQLGIDVFELRR